jgi:glycosyltransferase involved in cell wall biosynthesis
MTKKVLILSSCISGGGAGRSLENYLKFKDPQIEAHIVVPERGVMGQVFEPFAKLWVVPQFVERIHRCRYNLPKIFDRPFVHILLNCFDLAVSMRKITKLGKKLQPDIIYCNHMLANPIGAYVGWRLKKPVVFHARNIHVAPFGRFFYNFLAKRKCVKKIICNSMASAELFLKSVPEKVIIVHNFLDLTSYDAEQIQGRLRSEFKIPKNAFVYGYSGRLLPKKGLPVLLNAFREVVRSYSNSYLVIVGDNDGGVHIDWKSRFKELVKEWKIDDRVIFTGFQKDVRPYLVDFDILVLPSIEPESFGRVLIEAMALKIPAVASSLGGIIEVIEEGKSGFLVPPNNVSMLTDKLEMFQKQPDLQNDFANKSFELVHEKFSAAKLSKKISAVFREI